MRQDFREQQVGQDQLVQLVLLEILEQLVGLVIQVQLVYKE